MREIIAADQPFVRSEVSADEALEVFADQPYKVEIIERVKAAGDAADDLDAGEVAAGDTISVYRNTPEFVDLCRGPHVPSTGRLGHFKLQKVAGAYWRGNEKGPMLQRIYGTAWESDAALQAHLEQLAEAEKRDHRRLATELDLLSFPSELGGGLAVWHPKGAIVRKLMEDYSRQRHEHGGYEFVYTPHLTKAQLFETSGHLSWYADGMYPPMEMDNGTYYMKPMNCPMHCLIFRSRQRSYRELPLRLFELGTVYRYERAGTLHGLMRIRGFTQDDSHIFCTRGAGARRDRLAARLRAVRAAGVRVRRLHVQPVDEGPGQVRRQRRRPGTRPRALRAALDHHGLEYESRRATPPSTARRSTSTSATPSVARGSCRRSSTTSTTPSASTSSTSAPTTPGTGRSCCTAPCSAGGAVLRGAPRALRRRPSRRGWRPCRSRLPVATAHEEYAEKVADACASAALGSTGPRRGPLGKRIRGAKLEKIPYILVVGDDDVAAGTVGVNRAAGQHQPERGVDLAGSSSASPTRCRPTDSRRGLQADGPYAARTAVERLAGGVRHDSGGAAGGVADDVPERAGSVFTRILAAGLPDDDTHIVHRGSTCFAILNAFPYAVGHVMVIPLPRGRRARGARRPRRRPSCGPR